MDGFNVVFGKVIKGKETVKLLEKYKSEGDKVLIYNCGEIDKTKKLIKKIIKEPI